MCPHTLHSGIVCVRTRYTVASYVPAHVTQWHRMRPHTLHSGTVCVRTRYTVASYVSAHVTQWHRMCPHTLRSGIVCVRTRYTVAQYVSAHVTQWHRMCPHTLRRRTTSPVHNNQGELQNKYMHVCLCLYKHLLHACIQNHRHLHARQTHFSRVQKWFLPARLYRHVLHA